MRTRSQGDKTVEDCEEWCDESKIGHCKHCKCRGCKHCHGDLAMPDWVLQGKPSAMLSKLQCDTFGLCNMSLVSSPLCLSVRPAHCAHDAPCAAGERLALFCPMPFTSAPLAAPYRPFPGPLL